MKRHGFFAGFSLWFGIIAASLLLYYVNVLLSVLLLIISIIIHRKRSVSFCLFFVGLAFLMYALLQMKMINPAEDLDGQKIHVHGKIVALTEPNNDTASYVVEIEQSNIRISIYTADVVVEYGDYVDFDVKLSSFRDNRSFSEKSYNFSKSILLKGTVSGKIIVSGKDNSVYSYTMNKVIGFRNVIKHRLLSGIYDGYGAIPVAMFLGDKSPLSDDLKYNISRSGVAHFTAVSGMHLSLIVHFLFLILGLTPLRRMRKVKFAVLLIVILFLMMLFNFTQSVMRASFMLILFYCGDMFFRKSDALNSVGVAVLLILIMSPFAAFDVGLILSVAGTISVCCISPVVCKFIFWSRRSIFISILELLISCVCASFCTAPFAGMFFGRISPASSLTTILITPFSSAVLICVIFSMLPFVGNIAVFICGLCSRIIVAIVNGIASFKYSAVPLDGYSAVAVMIVFIVSTVLILKIFKFERVNVHAFSKHSKKKIIKRCAPLLCAILFLITVSVLALIPVHKDRYIEIFSSGNGGQLVLYGDKTIVISSDDNYKMYTHLRETLDNNFIDKPYAVILLSSKNNAVSFYRNLNSEIFVFSAGDEKLDLGSINVDIVHDDKNKVYNAVLYVDNKVINVISSKSVDSLTDLSGNLNIIYGYRKKLNEQKMPKNGVVFTDRKMFPYEAANAFYNEIYFSLE